MKLFLLINLLLLQWSFVFLGFFFQSQWTLTQSVSYRTRDSDILCKTKDFKWAWNIEEKTIVNSNNYNTFSANSKQIYLHNLSERKQETEALNQYWDAKYMVLLFYFFFNLIYTLKIQYIHINYVLLIRFDFLRG